jgi:hypothetical protein
MKHCYCVLLCWLLAGLAAAQTAPSAKSTSPLEGTMISREISLIEARIKNDSAILERSFANDFTMVGVDGKLVEGEEALDEARDSDVEGLSPYNFKILAINDNTVIVSYELIVKTPPAEDQGPPPRYQHVSSVWTRQTGEWKLKFQQITPTHWGDW